MATIDFYAILELPNTATDEDVRKAYRRLAIRWHPDKNPHDVGTAERRFKEASPSPPMAHITVAEAYEVLRDPIKRRQYDRVRTGRTRPRRATSWFGNTDGFGDDLWSDDGWGGSGPDWAFRNPFDVFKEFFGERDPWANMTPRSRREGAKSSMGSSFSWSMGSEPFFSRPFSSPFFTASRSSGSLFDLLDQRRAGGATPTPLPAQPERTTRVEIKIRGFSDGEDSSSSDDDEEEGEVVVEQVVIDDDEAESEIEEEEVEAEEDVALKEAIRLSLEQENERKRNQQRVTEQTEEDLEEAIRRSLADLEQQPTRQHQAAPTGGDWMDVEEREYEPRTRTRERGIPSQASDRHHTPVLH